MVRMELREEIAVFLEREGISQQMLAEAAGVDQATVSRALRREPVRRTAAHARLRVYMQQHASGLPAGAASVLDAVRETWDGSQAHAAALADLILASRELWPGLEKESSR
jgi:IS30 family transposase